MTSWQISELMGFEVTSRQVNKLMKVEVDELIRFQVNELIRLEVDELTG